MFEYLRASSTLLGHRLPYIPYTGEMVGPMDSLDQNVPSNHHELTVLRTAVSIAKFSVHPYLGIVDDQVHVPRHRVTLQPVPWRLEDHVKWQQICRDGRISSIDKQQFHIWSPSY